MSQHSFAGSKSMAENYQSGVDRYYANHGEDYRNPHFPAIVKAVHGALQTWLRGTVLANHPELSGDVRQAIASAASAPAPSAHIWAALQPHGRAGSELAERSIPSPGGPHVDSQAARDCGNAAKATDGISSDDPAATVPQAGADIALTGVETPACEEIVSEHAQAVRGGQMSFPACPVPQACSQYHAGRYLRVLDLACGSGEATQAVAAWWAAAVRCAEEGASACAKSDFVSDADSAAECTALVSLGGLSLALDAADPYTGAAFVHWTGRDCETFSFEDVASGYLLDEGRSYHICVCSYAMHVLDTSYLYATLQQLALVSEALLIVSPHKLPPVDEDAGWSLQQHETVERVHTRLYRSTLLLAETNLQLLT